MRWAWPGLAYLAFNNFHAATINWQSFSMVAFAFAVTPALLVQAMTWAAGLGLLGGLFPALRAARLCVGLAHSSRHFHSLLHRLPQPGRVEQVALPQGPQLSPAIAPPDFRHVWA